MSSPVAAADDPANSSNTPSFDILMLDLEHEMYTMAANYGQLVSSLKTELHEASSLNLAHIEQFHTLSVDVSRTVVASVDHARAVIDKTKALHQQCQSIQQLEQQVIKTKRLVSMLESSVAKMK